MIVDGWVPVGRMRYAPTEAGIAGYRQVMREGFFIVPTFREADFWSVIVLPLFGEADFRPAIALTFLGKLISGWRQCLLFGGS